MNLLQDDPEAHVDPAGDKDLSFLLDAAIFHPLSQVDVPPPLRKPFARPPPAGTNTTQALAQVDALVAQCDLLGAAHLAAICLTGGLVQPTEHNTIFKLLAIRYSCLELTSQTLLAAQEAKALEDLSSDFYYIASQVSEEELEAHNGQQPLARHVMPFPFRVQAMRLQNIGFSDPRRGITALYDLGMEVRENIASPYTTEAERQEWIMRLETLSMHVVNTLIELGDLDCAQRTLAQSKPTDPARSDRWTARMVLVLVKLGQLKQAQSYLDQLVDEASEALFSSVIAVADGRLDAAAAFLESMAEDNAHQELASLAKQNLAVAYLYSGRIQQAAQLLEQLVSNGQSFHSLTINLATIFDLTSDKSRDQKVNLVNKLASSQPKTRTFANADFKL